MCTGLKGPPRIRVSASSRCIGTGFLDREALSLKFEFSFDDFRGGCCHDRGAAKVPIVSYGDDFGGGSGGACCGGGGGSARLPIVSSGDDFGGGGGGSCCGGRAGAARLPFASSGNDFGGGRGGSCGGGGGGAWSSMYVFIIPSAVCRNLRGLRFQGSSCIPLRVDLILSKHIPLDAFVQLVDRGRVSIRRQEPLVLPCSGDSSMSVALALS